MGSSDSKPDEKKSSNDPPNCENIEQNYNDNDDLKFLQLKIKQKISEFEELENRYIFKKIQYDSELEGFNKEKLQNEKSEQWHSTKILMLKEKCEDIEAQLQKLTQLHSSTKTNYETELTNILAEIKIQKQKAHEMKQKNLKEEELQNAKLTLLKAQQQNIAAYIEGLQNEAKVKSAKLKKLQNQIVEQDSKVKKVNETIPNSELKNTANTLRWLEDSLKPKSITDILLFNEYSFQDKTPLGLFLETCIDKEYEFVKNKFMATTQSHFCVEYVRKFVSISRKIDYKLRKKEFQLLHGKENMEEQWLFRGTRCISLENDYDRSQNDPSFPHPVISFTPISNHANRRCDSKKLMILARVLTCKRATKEDAHNEFCKRESIFTKDTKNRPKTTYYKYNHDEFYPEYLIHFAGDTIKKS